MARAAGPQRRSCSSSSAVSPDAWFRLRNIGRKPSVGAAGSLLEREAWVLSIAETIEASQALPTDVMRAEGPAAGGEALAQRREYALRLLERKLADGHSAEPATTAARSATVSHRAATRAMREAAVAAAEEAAQEQRLHEELEAALAVTQRAIRAVSLDLARDSWRSRQPEPEPEPETTSSDEEDWEQPEHLDGGAEAATSPQGQGRGRTHSELALLQRLAKAQQFSGRFHVAGRG